MEAPQGTKTRSTIFFSSPTLRHISTKIELNKIHAPSVHIYLCEHVGAGELPRSPVRLVLGLGAGASAAGISRGMLREPQTETPGPVVWFPGSRTCRGSEPHGGNPGLRQESGPGHPLPPSWEGLGLQGPKSWDAGRELKERGGKKPTTPGIPRWSPIQGLRQARLSLAYGIGRNRVCSGCDGPRRTQLPPGTLRALRCASL